MYTNTSMVHMGIITHHSPLYEGNDQVVMAIQTFIIPLHSFNTSNTQQDTLWHLPEITNTNIMLTFRLLTLMYTKVCFKIINTRTFNKVWKNIPILNNPLWEKLFLKQLTFNHRKQYFYQVFLRKIYHVHNLQRCSQSLFTILKVLISNKVSTILFVLLHGARQALSNPTRLAGFRMPSYGRVPISSFINKIGKLPLESGLS